MKWIKRLCSFIFLCLFLVVAFMLWRGYGDCQDALKKMSVQQMGAQIQAKEDYTTLDHLPKRDDQSESDASMFGRQIHNRGLRQKLLSP